MSIQPLFDYESLDVGTRIVVQQKASEIKERVRKSREDILAIGERLIEVKERLGHGSFGEWLQAEFEWTVRTAQGFMNVAEAFKSEIISHLDVVPTALYTLAAPSVPEEARTEAIDRASNGQHIGTREAKEIIERHRPPENVFEREYRLDPELNFGPIPREPETPPARPSTNGHAPAATQRPPEKSQAERHRDRFLARLDDIDDLTRAIAAEVCHGGYGGFPAVLETLSLTQRLRVRGTVETLMERLQDWLAHFPEFPDEQDG